MHLILHNFGALVDINQQPKRVGVIILYIFNAAYFFYKHNLKTKGNYNAYVLTCVI